MTDIVLTNERPRALALVVAAGRGCRMAASTNKLALRVCGRPILAHTLQTLQDSHWIDDICLICRQDEMNFFREDILEVYGLSKVETMLIGGKERKDSVWQGLQWAWQERRWDVVAIHDGARPLVSEDTIERSVSSAREYGTGVAAVPVIDTIKRVDDKGRVKETLDRKSLWQIQTPQSFRLELIREAYASFVADKEPFLDDAMLVEKLGHPVRLVEGSYENLKVTTPEDLCRVEAIMEIRKKREEPEPA